MKKLALLLVFLASITLSYAQSGKVTVPGSTSTNMMEVKGTLKVDSGIFIMVHDTVGVLYDSVGTLCLSPRNYHLYVKTPTQWTDLSGTSWGNIFGNLGNQADLIDSLNTRLQIRDSAFYVTMNYLLKQHYISFTDTGTCNQCVVTGYDMDTALARVVASVSGVRPAGPATSVQLNSGVGRFTGGAYLNFDTVNNILYVGRITTTSNGSLYIGGSLGNGLLSAGTLTLQSEGPDPIYFKSNGSNVMAVDQLGAIYLGPSLTPGTAGQVLTSDGISGPAYWSTININAWNGLSDSSGVIELGGPLVKGTYINTQDSLLGINYSFSPFTGPHYNIGMPYMSFSNGAGSDILGMGITNLNGIPSGLEIAQTDPFGSDETYLFTLGGHERLGFDAVSFNIGDTLGNIIVGIGTANNNMTSYMSVQNPSSGGYGAPMWGVGTGLSGHVGESLISPTNGMAIELATDTLWKIIPTTGMDVGEGKYSYDFYGFNGDAQGWGMLSGYGVGQYIYYDEVAGGTDWWNQHFAFTLGAKTIPSWGEWPGQGLNTVTMVFNSTPTYEFNPWVALEGGAVSPVDFASTDVSSQYVLSNYPGTGSSLSFDAIYQGAGSFYAGFPATSAQHEWDIDTAGNSTFRFEHLRGHDASGNSFEAHYGENTWDFTMIDSTNHVGISDTMSNAFSRQYYWDNTNGYKFNSGTIQASPYAFLNFVGSGYPQFDPINNLFHNTIVEGDTNAVILQEYNGIDPTDAKYYQFSLGGEDDPYFTSPGINWYISDYDVADAVPIGSNTFSNSSLSSTLSVQQASGYTAGYYINAFKSPVPHEPAFNEGGDVYLWATNTDNESIIAHLHAEASTAAGQTYFSIGQGNNPGTNMTQEAFHVNDVGNTWVGGTLSVFNLPDNGGAPDSIVVEHNGQLMLVANNGTSIPTLDQVLTSGNITSQIADFISGSNSVQIQPTSISLANSTGSIGFNGGFMQITQPNADGGILDISSDQHTQTQMNDYTFQASSTGTGQIANILLVAHSAQDFGQPTNVGFLQFGAVNGSVMTLEPSQKFQYGGGDVTPAQQRLFLPDHDIDTLIGKKDILQAVLSTTQVIQAVASGGSETLGTNSRLILSSSIGTLTDFSIGLPASANNGDLIDIFLMANITTINWTGGTVTGQPTTYTGTGGKILHAVWFGSSWFVAQ